MLMILGGLILAGFVGVAIGALIQANSGTAPAAVPSLPYDVEAVSVQHVEAYRQIYAHPPFSEFLEAVLGNPGYSKYHDALRADALKFKVMYNGLALFVRKVGPLP